jgi:hypothetical protein
VANTAYLASQQEILFASSFFKSISEQEQELQLKVLSLLALLVQQYKY